MKFKDNKNSFFYLVLSTITFFAAVILKLDLNNFFLDFARPYQIGFQDPASPIMEGIIDLHHYIFFFLLVVFIFVFWIFLAILVRFLLLRYKSNNIVKKIISNPYFSEFNYFKTNKNETNSQILSYYFKSNLRNIQHSSLLEIVWTILPTIVLILIAAPSFILLYALDEVYPDTVGITLKVIGHQWYWSYEIVDTVSGSFISDPVNYEIDSYMIAEEDLNPGDLRLLEVDNTLVLPTNTVIRIIVTSTDVLHSWAVPSLGVKIDAVPGRLNQTVTFIKREGTYYGQCSEICGILHGFMPIKIQAIDPNFFKLTNLQVAK